MLLTLHVLLSEWCVRFGAGIVVPLECRCKVLVQGVACCQSGVYSLERCDAGASEGCCCTLQGAVVGFFSEAAGGVV